MAGRRECGIRRFSSWRTRVRRRPRVAGGFPGAARSGVLVLCGRGNKRRDGFVIARRLLGRGVPVRTMLLARREEVRGTPGPPGYPGEAGRRPGRNRRGGNLSVVQDAIGSAGLVVDELLGTGARVRPRPNGCRDRMSEPVGRPVYPWTSPPPGRGPARAAGPAVPRRADGGLRASEAQPGALPGRRIRRRGARGGHWYSAQALGPCPMDVGLLEAADVAAAFPARARRRTKAPSARFGHRWIAGRRARRPWPPSGPAGGSRLGDPGVPASLHDIVETKLTETMTVPVPETRADHRPGSSECTPRLGARKGRSRHRSGLGTHPSTQASCGSS